MRQQASQQASFCNTKRTRNIAIVPVCPLRAQAGQSIRHVAVDACRRRAAAQLRRGGREGAAHGGGAVGAAGLHQGFDELARQRLHLLPQAARDLQGPGIERSKAAWQEL